MSLERDFWLQLEENYQKSQTTNKFPIYNEPMTIQHFCFENL